MVSEPSSTRSPDLSAPEPPSDLSYVQKVCFDGLCCSYGIGINAASWQKLFTSVTSMGFPANAVERAVKHHGTDEKKVVDFAVAFTPLMSTGLFAPEDIDIALLLFESDYERADKFLRGSARLREMGFDKVDVQEAMLHKNNDEMAAAEWLLAGKKG